MDDKNLGEELLKQDWGEVWDLWSPLQIKAGLELANAFNHWRLLADRVAANPNAVPAETIAEAWERVLERCEQWELAQ